MATTTQTPTTISKAEAIRKAFTALGSDASQKDVAAYVQKHHGLDVGSANISQERCKLPKPAPVSVATVAPGTNGTPTTTTVKPEEADDETLEGLEAVFAVKALAKKVGGLDNLTALIAAYKSLVNC